METVASEEEKARIRAIEAEAASTHVHTIDADGVEAEEPTDKPLVDWAKYLCTETLGSGARAQVLLVDFECLWKLFKPFQERIGESWKGVILRRSGSFEPIYDSGAFCVHPPPCHSRARAGLRAVRSRAARHSAV
jgi:hypothetical protein